jgi:hypothetical protein
MSARKNMGRKLGIGMLIVSAILVLHVTAAQGTTDISTQTATGCLRNAATPRLYTLTDENGKLWNLRSQIVRLESHDGHTVTVKGTIPKESTGGDDTSPQNNLLVTKLDKVRDNRKQP